MNLLLECWMNEAIVLRMHACPQSTSVGNQIYNTQAHWRHFKFKPQDAYSPELCQDIFPEGHDWAKT